MVLEFVALHYFTDGCIACEPFGDPKRSVESESFNGVFTSFPVDGMDKIWRNVASLTPMFNDVMILGMVI
jgi:hypothetical protein